MGRFACIGRAQLAKSKCYTKNYWLESVEESVNLEESVKVHTEHNF